MIHELKTLPVHFGALTRREKTFELRFDDRGFQVGDTLILREWCPRRGYSGHIITVDVSHILRWADFPDALSPGFVVMSFRESSLALEFSEVTP